MLIEQTIDKLVQMKLNAMAAVLREQMNNADYQALSFEDRLSLLVDRQWDEKESRALTRRLRPRQTQTAGGSRRCRLRHSQTTGQNGPVLHRRVRVRPLAPQRHHNRSDRRRQNLHRLRHRQQSLPNELQCSILPDRQSSLCHRPCPGGWKLSQPCAQA